MTGDDRWYEAAFVVGITNALNVVADGLGGAVMRQVEPETAPAEVRAIFADIRTFYGTGGPVARALGGQIPTPFGIMAHDAAYLADVWAAVSARSPTADSAAVSRRRSRSPCRSPRARPSAPRSTWPSCDASASARAASWKSSALRRCFPRIRRSPTRCSSLPTWRPSPPWTHRGCPIPGPDEPPAMSDDARERAIELWREAYRRQLAGDLDGAIEIYRRSIATCPTAEAHTFLGWTYSFQGRLDDATAECLRAIEVDPDFGNPYNDIGVYLMQQGKLEEAIPWLERAKKAPRYEPRQFPFMNLGRIYLKQGRWWDALRQFEDAVRLAPADPEPAKALHSLRGRLN